MIRLLSGDCRDVLPTLAAESVQCCVTSPPYFGLRDYGTALWNGGDADCDHTAKQRKRGNAEYTNGQGGSFSSNLQAWGDRDVSTVYRDTCGKCGAVRVDRQIGLEATPDEYLATMVQVFREVRRVLRRDGTCWVNMGDSYVASRQQVGRNDEDAENISRRAAAFGTGAEKAASGGNARTWGARLDALAPKQLLLMPARLALALQADGWWVRSAIVWAKPNPMPESVSDRPTSAYEMVYLLTRSARYFYDAEAVREKLDEPTRTAASFRDGGVYTHDRATANIPDTEKRTNGDGAPSSGRNLRNVWTIATHAYSAAHFATFPPELAERCIKAGTRPGDTVLDPFAGAGTTLLVADRLQRDAIGVELNTQYTELAMERCRQDAPLFTAFPPAEPPEDMRMADLFTDMAAD